MISPNDIRRTTCEKTEYGFYQYRPLPSKAELQEYYSQKYYQQGKGSYDVAYTLEEINYFRLKAELIYKKLGHLRDLGKKKDVLDIGCGEGWVLDQFAKAALKFYSEVAQTDGVVEKLEAQAKIEASRGYLEKITRLNR